MSPGCGTRPCDRDATIELPPSPMGSIRRFCTPCYRAWRRGANTVFTQGVPKGESIGGRDGS